MYSIAVLLREQLDGHEGALRDGAARLDLSWDIAPDAQGAPAQDPLA
ncbi:hypothetical protein [Paraburkholderia tropica]|nr:hypothetical protein [Paraburkholderia tropica]